MKFPSLLALVRDIAVSRGSFLLASGDVSDYYVDVKKFAMHYRGMRLVGGAAWALVEELRLSRIDAVAGPELGGVPVACAVAMSVPQASDVSVLAVRKSRDHGLEKLVEGPLRPGMRVLVVEDVVTTAGSAVRCVKTLRDAGCEVVAVLSVVDRSRGRADQALSELGLRHASMILGEDLDVGTQEPAQLPPSAGG